MTTNDTSSHLLFQILSSLTFVCPALPPTQHHLLLTPPGIAALPTSAPGSLRLSLVQTKKYSMPNFEHCRIGA